MKHLYYDYKKTETSMEKLGLIDENTVDAVGTVLSYITAQAKADTMKNETVPNLCINRHCGHDENGKAIAYDAIVTVFADCGAITLDECIELYNTESESIDLACDDFTVMIDLEKFASKSGKETIKKALHDISIIQSR